MNTTDSNIKEDDVRWYRFIKDNNNTMKEINQQDGNMTHTSTTINDALLISLTITNAIKSYTGYYWVRISSNNVCNVSLTVITGM